MYTVYNSANHIHTEFRDNTEIRVSFEISAAKYSSRTLNIYLMLYYPGLNFHLGRSTSTKKAMKMIDKYYEKNYDILKEYVSLRDKAKELTEKGDSKEVEPQITTDAYPLLPADKLHEIKCEIYAAIRKKRMKAI